MLDPFLNLIDWWDAGCTVTIYLDSAIWLIGPRFLCRFGRDQNVCPTDVVSIDEWGCYDGICESVMWFRVSVTLNITYNCSSSAMRATIRFNQAAVRHTAVPRTSATAPTPYSWMDPSPTVKADGMSCFFFLSLRSETPIRPTVRNDYCP